MVGSMLRLAAGKNTDVGDDVTSNVGVDTAVDDVKGKQNDKNFFSEQDALSQSI
jgi:hypothetical protein